MCIISISVMKMKTFGKKNDNLNEIYDYIESQIENDIENLSNGKDIVFGDMEAPDFDESMVFQSISNQINRPSRRQSVLRYAKWAAIFIVMLCTGYITYNIAKVEQVEMAEIYSPKGKKTVVILADGSKVNLNSDTHLFYPKKFTGNTREVYIIGEAYFTVESDKSHPFIVRAKDMTVKVTGTEFNLRAYREDSCIITSLDKGKVFIGTSGKKELAELNPGQYAKYSTSGKTCSIGQIKDLNMASSWKDDMFNFNGSTLNEILKEMSRQFDVSFNIKNPKIRDYTYNITCSSKNINEIINIIETVTPVKFKDLGDGVYQIK